MFESVYLYFIKGPIVKEKLQLNNSILVFKKIKNSILIKINYAASKSKNS